MYSCVSRRVGLDADCHEPQAVELLAAKAATGKSSSRAAGKTAAKATGKTAAKASTKAAAKSTKAAAKPAASRKAPATTKTGRLRASAVRVIKAADS